MAAFPVDASDRDIEAGPREIGETGREGAGTASGRPRSALKAGQQLPHGFGSVKARSGPGGWKPTPRGNLPMIHPTESSGCQGMERLGGQQDQGSLLHDLLPPQELRQSLESGCSGHLRGGRGEVDLQVDMAVRPVPPAPIRPGPGDLRPRGLEQFPNAGSGQGRRTLPRWGHAPGRRAPIRRCPSSTRPFDSELG
jgi:hypothetical protein